MYDSSENLKLFQNKKITIKVKTIIEKSNHFNTTEMSTTLKILMSYHLEVLILKYFIILCNFISLNLPMHSTIHLNYDSFVQQLS